MCGSRITETVAVIVVVVLAAVITCAYISWKIDEEDAMLIERLEALAESDQNLAVSDHGYYEAIMNAIDTFKEN